MNCTFSANAAGTGGSGNPSGPNGAGAALQVSGGTIQNSILWGNSPDQLSGSISVSYCDVQGGAAGTGNISADPQFSDAPGGDYSLAANSPCIDAGNNASVPPDTLDLDGDGNTAEQTPLDLSNFPRFRDDPNAPDSGVGTPPIVDMGAYEGRPTGGCPADLDGDGSVALGDLAILLSHFGSGDADPADGDLDGDGDVDLADLSLVLSAFGTACP